MEETSDFSSNIEAAHHETNIENRNKLPRSFDGEKKLGECFAETRQEKYWRLLGNA